jgi:hypothetical protein
MMQTENVEEKYAVSDVCLSTKTSQKRFSDEVEDKFEIDRYHPPDDFEFARGAMIAAAIGVAMWAVIFAIVKLVFS